MSHPPSPPASTASSATATANDVTWADPAREAAFMRWVAPLAQPHGLDVSTLSAASSDASFRRYLRLTDAAGQHSAIVMDAPPDKEDCRPFVKVTALMEQAGVPAPRILAWDEPTGFMMLSDLGHHTMMGVVQANLQAELPAEWSSPDATFVPRPTPGAATQALYRDAVDLLLRWQLSSKPGVLPPYDQALLRRELNLFPDWYLAKHRGIDLGANAWTNQANTLADAFNRIVGSNLAAPSVYVHRDFMPRNLMVTVDAQHQVGLAALDFQDAVHGPVTYDIASLMRDAFLSWDEEFVIDITVRYWEKARTKGLLDFEDWHANFDAFYRAVEWMGLQRHLKVAGIFARITLRDGKPRYLADAPRFIQYIRHTCGRYRDLAPLLRLVDEVEGIQANSTWVMGRG